MGNNVTVPTIVFNAIGAANQTVTNPSGTTYTVEWQKINTIANILLACVNSSGATSTTETVRRVASSSATRALQRPHGLRILCRPRCRWRCFRRFEIRQPLQPDHVNACVHSVSYDSLRMTGRSGSATRRHRSAWGWIPEQSARWTSMQTERSGSRAMRRERPAQRTSTRRARASMGRSTRRGWCIRNRWRSMRTGMRGTTTARRQQWRDT